MNPVMLHADGSDCHHDGQPKATLLDEGGPLCPGGQPVTHVRFNGRVLTIEEAYASIAALARTFARALNPVIAAFAEFGGRISADPAIRALAAAADVVSEERRREAGDWATCAEPVWDGPYKMPCGRLIIEGECARHGMLKASTRGGAGEPPSPSLVAPHQRAPEGKSEQAHGSGHGEQPI